MIARTKVEKVIGKTFADKLDEVVITIGTTEFTRRLMVDSVGCANFMAASRLNKILKRLGITTILQLFKLDPASLARTRGIGEACIFVAMCILETNGYSSLKWWGTDSSKFSSVKHKTIRKARKNKQDV